MRRKPRMSRIERIFRKQGDTDIQLRVLHIAEEFARGFAFLRQYADGKKVATIFGSARIKKDSPAYREIYELAFSLAQQGYIVITGGGPGSMEAANHGAHDAGGISLGINITLPRLPKKETANGYVDEKYLCKYFFARKTLLSFAAHVYIFVPGGFGTLDEMFEMLTLVQTKKIPHIPIILKGRAYYAGLMEWLTHTVQRRHKMISQKDLSLIRMVDTTEETLCLIRRLEKDGETQCCCQTQCPQ